MDTKGKIINKLDDARDLILEAKYIIEDLLSKHNLLGTQNLEYLNPIAEIIQLLSQIRKNAGVNDDLPIEGVYKLLYCDYKKACQEKKNLQKDIVELMKAKDWDTDTATLNLKLMRAEREIESLKMKLSSKKNKLDALKYKLRDLRRQINKEDVNLEDNPLDDEEDEI